MESFTTIGWDGIVKRNKILRELLSKQICDLKNEEKLELIRRMKIDNCIEYEYVIFYFDLLWKNRVKKCNVAVYQPIIKYLESHYIWKSYGYMNSGKIIFTQFYVVLEI